MSLDNQLRAEYQGKIVWVTGAGQGIGLSTANAFHALGAKVIGFDKAFSDTTNIYKAVNCDLSDSAQLEKLLSELVDSGLSPYNLINVAGVLEFDSLDALTLTQWQHCQRVNSSAIFLFIQACYKHFKYSKQGSIVTVGSNAAKTPRQKMAAYCASKAAATQLTLTAGIELANYGIRCNVIAPGSTLTPMQTGMWQDDSGEKRVIEGFAQEYKMGIPLQKIATPDEIARSIIFVASALSSHTTMQVITIDGGATF